MPHATRKRLLSMTEFQREEILEERMTTRQNILNARELKNMVRQQQQGYDAGDSVARAAKRQHTARGATKEKAHKLDELKAKRKAKDEKSKTKGGSPRRSKSPEDMDISDSDEDSEEGMISKVEQEEERLLNLTSGAKRTSGSGKEKEEETPATMADLESCRLTRDAIAKHCVKPWFEDYVKGAWVRYLIGQETTGQPVYRICEISNLAPDLVKPYKVNEQIVNQAFELKHGASTKVFNMDKVSNGGFTDREFDRLVKVARAEHVKLPTKQALERKVAQMTALIEQPMTEKDINAMLQRKAQLQAQTKKAGPMSAIEKSRLTQLRDLALKRRDMDEVREIDAKLAEDAAKAPEPARPADTLDLLAKVNERNRKANLESVRRAEIAEAERKRRERKLAAQNGVSYAPSDPSARLKTIPKTFTPTGTRLVKPGTPSNTTTTTVSGLEKKTEAPVRSSTAFEQSLIESVDIDLGDF
ncbi:hypothetical protein CVT24_012490 [Panaeolus cyanescens]|uniref:Plus3 domain-containing protein n=1 Tax=Panaeolus cyanescens TaxID=181874 RepID=A0A409YK33_9AGAR|nr:hypothetical protein CVT24_012490 [Panaeolus cyanescens]